MPKEARAERQPPDLIRAALHAAGFVEHSQTPSLDLTWEALYAALGFLSPEELEPMTLGWALGDEDDNPDTDGHWTARRQWNARWQLLNELQAAVNREASATSDPNAAPPKKWLDEEDFDKNNRDLARLGVAAVLTYDITTLKVAPKRVLTNALALGLLAVADPRFSLLTHLLKGSRLTRPARELGAVGSRLRLLLFELRYEKQPSANLLARLQNTFERLKVAPGTKPNGTLLLREGPNGPEALLNGRTCPLSERQARLLRVLPPASRPVEGSKTLADLWGLTGLGSDRTASSSYSQCADKLEDKLEASCLLRGVRGKYGLVVEVREGIE